MGSRYLTDLATVCRNAGLVVQEEPGWQSRSRSSGGYDSGRPTHVMVHHTASGPGSDGQADVNYCCYGSSDRPLANVYLARSGKVWVMAAGATNTNGKGGPIDNVPADSMNTYAIGIEAANGGTGEPWPKAQTDAYVKLVSALQQHYGLPGCRAHAEWAPGRKIDPAGPSPWATGSATWNMTAFRSSVASGGSSGPTPTPTPPERKKKMYVLLQDDKNVSWATDNMSVRYLYNSSLLNTFKSMLTVFGYGTAPTKVKQADILAGCYGVIVGVLPGGLTNTTNATNQLAPWGLTLVGASGQPGARADVILQEIRAAVKK